MDTDSKIEIYISKHSEWKKGLQKLRSVFLNTQLKETIKWGIPTYTINGKNVAGIGAFKNHFGIWFFNGVFLKDPHHLLVNAQEGKTQGTRQMRFTSEDEIDQEMILSYLKEAIENQKQGKEIKPQEKKLIIPPELKEKLRQDRQLSEAFEALAPGKQREYAEYISEAKRPETRSKRLEKIAPMILSGIGLNDRYK